MQCLDRKIFEILNLKSSDIYLSDQTNYAYLALVGFNVISSMKVKHIYDSSSIPFRITMIIIMMMVMVMVKIL